jgi:K+-sensing histidine kinase KdpD
MATLDQPRRRPLLQAAISIVAAATLLALATLGRLALGPHLADIAAPFMLYVAAVLAAGLLRGAFCGGLVLLGGGFLGLRLFLSPHGVPQPGAVVSLMLFWGVSALVLVTANELRVQLGAAMRRLSAALERRRAA